MKAFIRGFFIILVIGLVIGTFFFLYQRSKPKQTVYETTSPKRMDIIKKTVASGSVVARKEIVVKSQASGIVEELLVEPGDMVKKDQVIARIRLIPNLLRLNDAETRVNKAEVSLDYAQKTYRRAKKRCEEAISSGEIIKAADSPNLIKLNQAEADLEMAGLNLAGVKNDYNRQKILVKSKIVSAADFEETSLALERAREAYDKALTHLRMMKSQTFDDMEAELQEAENALKQAREERQSSKDNLKLILDGISPRSPEKSNTLVRSTIDGMVLDIPLKEGSAVIEINTQNTGTTIATVADMNDMVFEGYVDESEINKIRTGMDLILTVGAIPDAKFDAKIEHIAPKGKEKEGAIQFYIRAKVKTNERYFIRAGYSAGADIVLDKREDALAVEEGNLIFRDTGIYAEVETGPNRFESRKIRIGISDGIHAEVLSGLTAEDRIKVQK